MTQNDVQNHVIDESIDILPVWQLEYPNSQPNLIPPQNGQGSWIDDILRTEDPNTYDLTRKTYMESFLAEEIFLLRSLFTLNIHL